MKAARLFDHAGWQRVAGWASRWQRACTEGQAHQERQEQDRAGDRIAYLLCTLAVDASHITFPIGRGGSEGRGEDGGVRTFAIWASCCLLVFFKKNRLKKTKSGRNTPFSLLPRNYSQSNSGSKELLPPRGVTLRVTL